jgi:hypothetical protein
MLVSMVPRNVYYGPGDVLFAVLTTLTEAGPFSVTTSSALKGEN